jgi:hypothetical protein
LAAQATHIAKITPPEEADQWLPWVHIVIANLKRFLLGTFHPKKSSTSPSRAVFSPRPGTRGDEIAAMPAPLNSGAGAIRGH